MITIVICSFVCLFSISLSYYVYSHMGRERVYFFNTIIKKQNETEVNTRVHLAYIIHEELMKEVHFLDKNQEKIGLKLEELDSNADIEELIDCNRKQEKALGLLKKNIKALNEEIYPSFLKSQDFSIALNRLIDSFSQNFSGEIKLNYQLQNNDLTDLVKYNIYGIVNIFISNSVLHSQCDTIDIKLRESKDIFSLHINDNGKGFDLENQTKFNRGMYDIRSRMISLNPIAQAFESNINQGTSLKLEFKIDAE